MKEKTLEKPTDNELRKQIKIANKTYDLLFFIGLVVGIITIISRRYIQGLMIGFIMFLMAGQFGIHQKLDKIRLEIRER